MEVPVGDVMIGRVVNALGQRSTQGKSAHRNIGAVEFPAPGIMDRQSVNGTAADGDQVHRLDGSDRPRSA